MKIYRHMTRGEQATAQWLAALGYDIEKPALLASCGWLEIRHEYPEHDARTQKIEPDGAPALNADRTCFIQKFLVLAKTGDELAAALELGRGQKLADLNAAFEEAQTGSVLQSSVGFAIDATERADRDIRGLITRLESNGETTTEFCAADNSFHEVTLENLKAMQLEIIGHGQSLYARKWKLREAINQATGFADLDAINISFEAV